MLKKICLLLSVFFVVLAFDLNASIIKGRPTKQKDLKYSELACTEQDRNNIYEIISTIGEKGKLSLLFQQGHLRELGAQINHVHPLVFLSTIFKDSYLKSCMFVVWDDYFKRTSFLEGLIPSLNREADKGKLNIHINDFAKDIGVKPESLNGYFEARDWENMVLFLIHS